MPWFKVDDKLHEHRKPRRAQLEAMGLWVLAGSYAGDNLTDGFIPEHALTRWCPSMAKGRKLATKLVEAGLWHPDTKDGEKGWRFHSWDEFQPSRAKVEGDREAARARMERVRANRHSSSEDVRPNQQRTSQGVRSPRPVPTRPVPTVVKSSSQLTVIEGGRTDDDSTARSSIDYEAIARATKGDVAHARVVADDVLSRANGPTIGNPTAYVLRAIGAEPERYKPRRRNTRADQCPIHSGPAENCGGCAADAKAAT